MATSRGKVYERELVNAIKRDLPSAFVHKFADVHLPHRGKVGRKSPPDVICVHPMGAFLIEAKAVQGTSIPFGRVSGHQLDALLAFDKAGGHGLVAVHFYNGLRTQAERVHRSWLVRASAWLTLPDVLGRKSLPMELLVERASEREMVWVPAKGWSVRPALESVCRP